MRLIVLKEYLCYIIYMHVILTRRPAEGKGSGLSRGMALPEIPKIIVIACGSPAYSLTIRSSVKIYHIFLAISDIYKLSIFPDSRLVDHLSFLNILTKF